MKESKTYAAPDTVKRWFPSLVILPLGIYLLISREYSLIDNFHLVAHEAGHFILGMFGEVIMFMGGTIMQLAIPGLLVLYFYLNRMRLLFQAGVVLEGHSFINVSIYAADAQTMELRLFGPPGAKHDWNWMLNHFGILRYSDAVAFFFIFLAAVCFIASALAPLYVPDRED